MYFLIIHNMSYDRENAIITYWISVGLEIRLHKHVHMHKRNMKNVWSKIVSCSSCFAFYCFSSFHDSYKQYRITLFPLGLAL